MTVTQVTVRSKQSDISLQHQRFSRPAAVRWAALMLCASTCDAVRHQVLLIGVIKVIVVAFVRLTTDRLVSVHAVRPG